MGLLVWKDLRIEARSRSTVALTTATGVLLVAVLGLGGGGAAHRAGSEAGAILWAALLFAGVLCVERTMAFEHEDDAIAGLMLAPVDRGTIYLSKLLTNLILMTIAAGVVAPVGIVLFGFDLSASPWGFALATALGLVGFAAVGTLLSAAVGGSRMRGGVLMLLALPLCLPLVVVSTRLAASLAGPGGASPGFGVLVAFDVVYVAASWLVFEFLLEA